MADESTALVQKLFVSHLPALRGFVTSLVSDFSLADDIVQETFLTVTAKADDFDPGTNFKAWAWSIARIKTLEGIRKAGREKHFAAAVIESLCSHDESYDWMEFERMMSHIGACVEQLAPKAQAIVELRYRQGHRAVEVARRMSWTVNAIHVALSRARRAIRECVQQRLLSENPASGCS